MRSTNVKLSKPASVADVVELGYSNARGFGTRFVGNASFWKVCCETKCLEGHTDRLDRLGFTLRFHNARYSSVSVILMQPLPTSKQPTRSRRKIILFVIVAAVIALLVVYELETNVFIAKSGQPEIVKSTFTFNNESAATFLAALNTSTGLLKTFTTSKTIYIADDQQLDYAALIKLGDFTLANQINSTMNRIGGLYFNYYPSGCSSGYWNAPDIMVGMFMPPSCKWYLNSGEDTSQTQAGALRNSSGYNILETEWEGAMGSGYVDYADLLLYYSLNELHYGDYNAAVSAFHSANSFWDGKGFADIAYKSSPNGYTSYKLAIDLIVFKALMNNSRTEGSAVAYKSTLSQVQAMMSKLQGKDGGVITNYEVGQNGQIEIPPNTYENGETTSLFLLAE
jgi:hypothetical protein